MDSDRSTPIPRTLLFTGLVQSRRYRVDVDGHSVWLSLTNLRLLTDLLLARARLRHGGIQASSMSILRLRQALGEIAGNERALALIQTVGDKYRLGIPRARLRECCAHTACFAELVGLKRISRRKYMSISRLFSEQELPS